jgi:hypothetical protein
VPKLGIINKNQKQNIVSDGKLIYLKIHKTQYGAQV